MAKTCHLKKLSKHTIIIQSIYISCIITTYPTILNYNQINFAIYHFKTHILNCRMPPNWSFKYVKCILEYVKVYDKFISNTIFFSPFVNSKNVSTELCNMLTLYISINHLHDLCNILEHKRTADQIYYHQLIKSACYKLNFSIHIESYCRWPLWWGKDKSSVVHDLDYTSAKRTCVTGTKPITNAISMEDVLAWRHLQ